MGPDHRCLKKREHAILLPHEAFSELYNTNKTKFMDWFYGGQTFERVLEFWSCCPGEAWFEKHEFREAILRDPEHCMPLRLHGDDAKQIMIESWSSSANRKFEHRVVVDVSEDELLDEEMSWDEIDRLLAWSLRCLAEGKWPALDWNDGPGRC